MAALGYSLHTSSIIPLMQRTLEGFFLEEAAIDVRRDIRSRKKVHNWFRPVERDCAHSNAAIASDACTTFDIEVLCAAWKQKEEAAHVAMWPTAYLLRTNTRPFSGPPYF